ncbi:GNAT family N-acetyltransferase [Coralloluteibacterium thermophilus]|uniref:GNAT family N-acetyltransferase n=1 Tax=Coralloluteibacterium thermophilum TaxID=2707049 RepID=A0ABV9NQM8_9GAMM
MSTPPLRLRDAVAADLPALLALEAAFPGDRLSPRQFRHHLRSPRARLRLAEAGGAVAGYALVLRRAGSARARLYSIIVAPAHAGRGLGARLLADAEAGAAAAGCRRMGLEVRADNLPAQALYRRAGYTGAGRRMRYYEDGADALRFEKALPAPAP